MRIGLASTDFERDFGTLPTRDLFAKVKAGGYQSIQLSFSSLSECPFPTDGNFDIPPSIPEGLCSLILQCSQEFGVALAAINGTYNTAHPDPKVRQEGLRRFTLLAKAAQELGVSLITLCSGSRCPHSMWTIHPENESLAAFAHMEESMVALAEIAERYVLSLAIEPEASNILNTPEKALKILALSPRLCMILDAANLFHQGTAKRENVRPTLDHAFAAYGHRIALAHGKDILEGSGISFCPGGEGIVDFPYLKVCLEQHHFSGDFIVHGVYNMEKFAPVHAYMQGIFG